MSAGTHDVRRRERECAGGRERETPAFQTNLERCGACSSVSPQPLRKGSPNVLARVSDYTAFMYLGELVEMDRTDQMFQNPANPLTEQYITGRFG